MLIHMELELRCYECGESLGADQYGDILQVRPCRKCADEQWDNAYADGLEDGKKGNYNESEAV